MARILLVMPRLPQRMGTPYLGQQLLAAALMADGHHVRCLDLAAPNFAPEGDAAADQRAQAEAERFAPDLVGLTLFTYSAARAYALGSKVRAGARLLVAGGPHPTVLPKEPLAHGFDASVMGEGEDVIRAIARALDQGLDASALMAKVGQINGVVTAEAGACGPVTLGELNGQPHAHTSLGAYDPSWYPGGATIHPAGGLMTSRGCPARCTFCANYVTGRIFRGREASDILDEMRALYHQHSLRHFSFWDDAFTASRPRLRAFCTALMADPELRGVTWSCITPANMVGSDDLERMRAAGCVSLNLGIESADPTVLKSIQKGQRVSKVETVVQAAKAQGMSTVVNIMFGFPEETLDGLKRTQEMMARMAPHTNYFNHRGVLVPFPGTGIYRRWASEYGFERWWLDSAKIIDELDPWSSTPEAIATWLETDPTLDLDFFRYDDARRDAIAAGVRFKAQHNARAVDRIRDAAMAAGQPQPMDAAP